MPLALWHKVNAGGPCGVQASRPPLVPGGTGSKLSYRPHHCSPAPRPTPHQRGQVVRRPSPPGYCLLPTAELAKIERGPISTSGPSIIQYVTEFQYVTGPGNFFGQIHPFLPARGRPTVDHSLGAPGAQGQWLQACLPGSLEVRPPWLQRVDQVCCEWVQREDRLAPVR